MTWAAIAAQQKVDETDVDPGVLGFLVVALLCVATVLLIRSMNRRIRHIELPEDEQHDREEPPAGGGTQSPGGRSS